MMSGAPSNDWYQMPESSPLTSYHMPKNEDVLGRKLLQKGKVGTIILAGGHGSRLGFDLPKGLYPISPVKQKTIFQLIAEKALAASACYKNNLMLAIMTSTDTHQATVKYFEEHDFFGLKRECVSFFEQQNLPVLDDTGQAVPNLLAPCGNGMMFWDFAASGLLNAWQQAGIEQITCFTVDNVLADPYEPNLIGLNAQKGADVTVVGIQRKEALESVGILVEKDGRVGVVEYSEMTKEEREKRSPAGNFMHELANISYFAFSFAFIKRISQMPQNSMPLHNAKKVIQGKQYIKQEYFVFDVLAFSDKTEVLLLDREECFAPLKNRSGPQSPETVREALVARDKKTYVRITGRDAPLHAPFELKPAIYYQNWHTVKDCIEDFIERDER